MDPSMMLGQPPAGGQMPMPSMPGGPTELAVPLSVLNQPDDQEVMQTPGQGDTVSLQVDATITRIEGETAYITPTAVNGKPLDENEATEDPTAADEAEGEALRGEALTL